MHAVVLFAIIHLLTTVAGVMDVEVHMLSFNIRTSLASIDARSSCGNWDGIRKTNVVNTIKTVAADFVGTQETSDAQKTFLDAQLADIYSVIGENTGHLNDMANEWNAIYYRFDTWKILTNGMFWLGTNPDVMSAGWGMIYYRTCVWGRFQHTKTGASICVLNTHYETPGNDAAQIQGSTIILEHIKTKCDPSDGLIVLMGDFNALKSYPAMRMLFANDLTDPSDDGTFCGDMLSGTCSTKYDYTMFRAQNKDACHLESKISRINYNGCYSSDHAGLVSTFCLQGSCCLKSSSGSRSIYSSFYENRIADDKDELGTVKGSNFSTVFHRKRTPKVDTEANTSVTMPKSAVESSSPSSPDPAQTIYMSSGGGNSASTSVGIILGSLGICSLIALVVIRRKEKLERQAHMDKYNNSNTTDYFAGPTAARTVSDASSLSPPYQINEEQASFSPIPELVAAPRGSNSTSSSVSIFNSEIARQDEQDLQHSRFSAIPIYVSSRQLSPFVLTSGTLEFSTEPSNPIPVSESDSNSLSDCINNNSSISISKTE